MSKLFLILFLLINFSLQASPYRKYELEDERNYAKYEQAIEKQIKQQNLNDQQKFQLYHWAIKKLENVNIRGFKKKYLKKILNLNIKNDKSPYLLKLSEIYYEEGDFVQLKHVTSYFPKIKPRSKFSELEVFYTLAGTQNLSHEFLSQPERQRLNNKRYRPLMLRHNMRIWIERKNWKKAFEISKTLPKNYLQYQLAYLYLSMVHKKKDLPSFCRQGGKIPLVQQSCVLLRNTDDKKLFSKTFKSLKNVFPEYRVAHVALAKAMEVNK